MNFYRATIVAPLIAVVAAIGCSNSANTDAGSIGQTIGKNVTEFAQGVGSGVDTQLQVEIELSPSLTDAGVTHSIAKQQASLGEPQKAISIYFISAKPISLTLVAKAYNGDNQEIGRATTEVQFQQDDAKYVPFTFPPEMDTQNVTVYKIDMRPPPGDPATP